MKTKYNLAGIGISSAAALFVALAGNVQAIPIGTHNPIAQKSLHASGQITQKNNLATTFLLSSSNQGKNAGGKKGGGSGKNSHHGVTTSPAPVTDQGAYPQSGLNAPLLPPVPVSLPQPPIIVASGGGNTAQNAVSVPDGGLTAAMVAGSLSGLALLRKKLKA